MIDNLIESVSRTLARNGMFDWNTGRYQAENLLFSIGNSLELDDTASLKADNVLGSARQYLRTGQTYSTMQGHPVSQYADYFFQPEAESDAEMERRTR